VVVGEKNEDDEPDRTVLSVFPCKVHLILISVAATRLDEDSQD
jgi:hypothetical protein